MKDKAIITLYKAKQTIFTAKDLSLLWRIDNDAYLRTKLHRLIEQRQIVPIRRGFYALSKEYDPNELANRMVTPSYISLQTVLLEAGAIFQYDSAIYSISNSSKILRVEERNFVYKKMKDAVLFSTDGLITDGAVAKATPERAFLDWLYLSKEATIDNMRVLNWEYCKSLLPIYKNHALGKRFNKIYHLHQKNDAE